MNHAALSGWVYLTLINLFKIATNGFLELITLVTESQRDDWVYMEEHG